MGGRMRWGLFVCVSGLLFPLHGSAQSTVPYVEAIQSDEQLLVEQRILRTLDRRMDFDFQETPLRDVVAFLNQRGIRIRLDTGALDDVGLDGDLPVRFRQSDLPVRSALKLILKEFELTWHIRDEMVEITTPDEAEAHLRGRLYDVTHLLPERSPRDNHPSHPHCGADRDLDRLIATVTGMTAPQTWDVVGGPGSIEPLELHDTVMLVVFQTTDIHEQIARLLGDLQRVVAGHNPASAGIRGSAMRQSSRLPRAGLSSVSIGRR